VSQIYHISNLFHERFCPGALSGDCDAHLLAEYDEGGRKKAAHMEPYDKFAKALIGCVGYDDAVDIAYLE
jgi:hypothetical protein